MATVLIVHELNQPEKCWKNFFSNSFAAAQQPPQVLSTSFDRHPVANSSYRVSTCVYRCFSRASSTKSLTLGPQPFFIYYAGFQDGGSDVSCLILSRIDYCNAVLHGAPSYSIKKLQRVRNNAARIVLEAPRRSHASPLLRTLHWLLDVLSVLRLTRQWATQ